MNNLSFSCEYVTQWQLMVIIDLNDYLNSWFRHLISGSYYNSYPNRRIFRKFWTYIIGGINNPGPSLGYVIRDM